MMYYCQIILAFMLLLATPGLGVADGPLKVNTSIKPPFSTKDETGFFDQLVKELGRRMGHGVELVRQPPERALFSVNEGISDAEIPRIAGMEKKYPNMVMVDEKVIDYEFVSFVRGNTNGEIERWDDLSGKRVAYLHGWKIFENNIPAAASVTRLNKPDLLFVMLDSGRVEVALYERYAGRNNIRMHGLTGIRQSGKPLAVKPMYLYFNQRHSHLAPLAAEKLREMKADGTYDRIRKQTLGE